MSDRSDKAFQVLANRAKPSRGQLLLPFHKTVPRSEYSQEKDARRKRLWQMTNKERLNAKRRKSRAENCIAYRAQTNARNRKNKARMWVLRKLWNKRNPGKQKEYAARTYRNKPYSYHKAYNTSKRMAYILRSRLIIALKGRQKSASTLALLGCSIELFKLHLQAQFRDGMAWNNHGSHWHIDHIKPCASFDLNNPEEQRACFHYTNMQPLLVLENRRKGCRVTCE